MTQKEWSVEKELKPAHELLIGETGSGKSTLLEQRFHKHTRSGGGCAVFSPSPGLIDSLLVRMRDSELQRTHLINPVHPHYSVGINILELVRPALTDEDKAAFAATFLLDVIRDTFGEEALQVRGGGILKELLSLMLLSKRHLAECYLAWDPGDEGVVYRDELYQAAETINPFPGAYVRRNIDVLPPSLRQNMLEASLNKLKPLFDYPALTCTLLQPEPTLDLVRAIDQDEIVLVDLSSVYLGEDGVRILGGFLLAAIYQSAIYLDDQQKREGRYWPVHCDEFADYCSRRILLGLAQARKLGLFFSLACQDRDLLERVMPKAWSSILINATRKACFRMTDELTRESLISTLWGFNPKLKESVGDWQAQKQMHAANLGALQLGQYFYQDGTLSEEDSPVGGEPVRYLKARLESTSGNREGGAALPKIRDPAIPAYEQAMVLREQLAAIRSSGRTRAEVYSAIKTIYKNAVTNLGEKLDAQPKKTGNRTKLQLVDSGNQSRGQSHIPFPTIESEEI